MYMCVCVCGKRETWLALSLIITVTTTAVTVLILPEYVRSIDGQGRRTRRNQGMVPSNATRAKREGKRKTKRSAPWLWLQH